MGRARSVPSKNIPLAVLALSVSSLVALASGGPAKASQLVDRNATNVHLQVNARGQALITYRASGRLRRVLGWGAMNARPSAAGGKQVSFRLDYSGGWGTYHPRLWRAVPPPRPPPPAARRRARAPPRPPRPRTTQARPPR